MIVVSNTSPVNYLVQIGAVGLLSQLFGTLSIPLAVHEELSNPDTPDVVRNWTAQPISWLKVIPVEHNADLTLTMLHRGEREAILLAEKLEADLLILNEKAARAIATQRGLSVIGTLGVLKEAGSRNLINIPETINLLRQTTFRAVPSFYKWLLEQHAKRIT